MITNLKVNGVCSSVQSAATSIYYTSVNKVIEARDSLMGRIVPMLMSSYDTSLPYAVKGLAIAQPYVVKAVSISKPLIATATPLVSYTYDCVEPMIGYGKKRVSENKTVGPLFKKALFILTEVVDKTLDYFTLTEGNGGLVVEATVDAVVAIPASPVSPQVVSIKVIEKKCVASI